ncbi:uncharacterized protein BDW43DRAFT_313134 [Aspergillus alliaceus]|uniref:uncharacterized protein n=1 Tax=Petromyces alliaceus TaxID=209559 RepID=UPI0012A4FB9E|nr:uncharacterized protein BDW43DRAFT_313134 [Aspergillus alliaceus]KAB8231320.1 hypothetical protein BDW43DRAFT_313134 [Aspergillus alliaceus]
MDERATGLSIPLISIPRLKGRVQLWHWCEEDEEYFLELNNKLASQAAQRRLPDWEVRRVESPDTPYRAGQTFVAIETEFIHTSITLNDPRALHEWNKLWKVILDLTPQFFRDIGGEPIVVSMMSSNLLLQGQPLYVVVDTKGPLKLRETIVPTRRRRPRSQSGWLARGRNMLSLCLFTSSLSGWIPWSYSIPATLTIYATSSVIEYINDRLSPPLLRSDEPGKNVAQTLGHYRSKYATWKDYMSQAQEARNPDIGIKRLEACRNLLIAFSAFETATLAHLTADIEPYCERIAESSFCLKAGATACVVGFAVCGAAACAAWTITAWCAGGVGVVSAVCACYGYFNPNIPHRELIQELRDLFKSLNKSLHTLYIRTWVSFYQNVLGIPFEQLNESEAYEVLKGCGVDLSFIQEVGYQKSLSERAMKQLQHDSNALMEKFRELFTKVGQEMIFQDVSA